MELLLAQGITETIEIQQNPTATIETKTEEPVKSEEESPVGGGIKEEITLPPPSSPPPSLAPFNSWGNFSTPSLPSIPQPVLPPLSPPKLPFGTITEKFIYPSIPATIPPQPTTKKMNSFGLKEEVHQQPSGQITYIREICDGEVHIGNFKSCLKEFTGVSAVGWIAAAAGLIFLWKWLEWRFKK